MKKLIKLFIAFITLLSLNLNCQALENEIKIGKQIPDVWVKIETPDYNYRTRVYELTNATTNDLVYCIEPGRTLNDGSYSVYNDIKEIDINLSEEKWDHVTRLAYVGYGYKDHQDIKWYLATQMVIWNYILGDTGRVYYVDDNFTPIEQYHEEEEIILDEAFKLGLTPSFTNGIDSPIYLDPFNTLEYNDFNNVLDDYDIIYDESKATITHHGNDFVFAPKLNNELVNITFNHKTTLTDPPKVYYNGTSQTVMSKGQVTLPSTTIQIQVISPQVIVKKYSTEDTDLSLNNAFFALYDLNDDLKGVYATNEEGQIVLPNLLGDYYLVENFAPYGFELNPNRYYFSVTKETLDNITIDIPNTPIKKKFKLEKYLKYPRGTFELEKNARFELYRNGDLYTSFTTDEYGKYSLELTYGNYVLKQTTGQEGFLLSPDLTFTVDDNFDETTSYILENSQITGSLIIQKIDADTKELILDEATFHLIDKNTSEVLTINDESLFKTVDGILRIDNIPYGEYLLEEVSSPKNYRLPSKKWDISIKKDKEEITLEIPNNYQTGSLKIIKKGSDDQKLPNVKFALLDANQDLIREFTTNSDGFILLDNLRIGTYYLQELETLPNYELNPDLIKIELTEDNQTIELEIVNNLKMGSLKIIKKDPNGNLLNGVRFGLFNLADEMIQEQTTINGEAIFLAPYGEYYLKELETLPNFKLNSEPISIIIDDKTTIELEIVNEYYQGTLIIQKKDSQTSLPLQGVVFAIYDEQNNLIFEGPTDINGQIIIDNLPTGIYTVKEILTKDNYILNDEEIVVEIKDDITTTLTVNNRLKVISPATGTSSKSITFLILGNILLLLGRITNHVKKNS